MSELRGFKFVETVVLVLKKIESEDKTKCDTFHSHSKSETIINESDIDDVFEILLIINQQKLEKLTRILPESLIMENKKFSIKIRNIHKIEKKEFHQH